MPIQRTARLSLVLSLLSALLLLGGLFADRPVRADGGLVPPQVAEAISRAVLTRLAGSAQYQVQAILYETRVADIRLARDQAWAVAWMIPLDRATGADLAVEPGLAILRQAAGEWQAALPLDDAWRDWLAALPDELLPAADQDYFLAMSAAAASPVPTEARGGYLLPWAKNKVVTLTRSLAHDQDFKTGSSHFSFDFADGTMFEVLAARDGVVWMTKDSEPNGCDQNSGCSGNYVVLKETDATGDYFQLYLHLAYDSIPPELVLGATVKQGDPVGLADDTGYSTGHHLHFMVHRSSTSYYSTAIDVTFDDVTINGGRPRAAIDAPYCLPTDACDVFQSKYISGNEPCFECIPPTGDFTAPEDGVVVTSTLQLSAYGEDPQTGMRYGQFLAAYGGKWVEISPQIKGDTFSYTWDLCAAKVPDGPIALGLRLRDNDHNTAELLGLRIVTKSYICPAAPPTCTPGPNEVSLFTSANYAGTCVNFPVGAYPNGTALGAVGADSAESLLLGANVQASLFAGEDMTGRGETFLASDSNLADNLIRANWTRSLMVQLKSEQPFVPEPAWPPSAGAFLNTHPLTLYWENPGAASEFQVRLSVPLTEEVPITTQEISSTWQSAPFWFLDSLDLARTPGLYTWQVRARNAADHVSAWSAPMTFTLSAPPPILMYLPLVNHMGASATAFSLDGESAAHSALAPAGVIFSDDVESEAARWQGTGLWQRKQEPIPVNAHAGEYFWWAGETDGVSYFYDSAKVSTLTSSPLTIPDSGTYYLRFYSYYETENDNRFWDQRWVQVSVNGGPFENLRQVYDDPLRYWALAAPISLEAYRGQVIRLRFVFDTVDNAPPGDRSNKGRGWLLDDITISDSAPGTCLSDTAEPNDDPASASVLPMPAGLVTGTICPAGDADYFIFDAQAGDRLLADLDARTLDPASRLDSVLELLDSDGRSLVALSDDEVRLSALDSILNLTLPRSGTYYLRVTSWYPGEGGDDYPYTLRFGVDAEVPQITLLSPPSDIQIKAGETITLSALITDTVSGLSRVDFLWHDPQWFTPTWQTIPGGELVGGVWQAVFDPLALSGSQPALDLYIHAFDYAGNAVAAGSRRIAADVVAPAVTLDALDPTQASNAYLLTWSGTDDLSGVGYFELERDVDSGGWTTILTDTLPGEHYEVVEPGHTYSYRLRAADAFGNLSAYITTTTQVPAAEVLCLTADAYEPDGASGDAQPAAENQAHTFCDPALPGYAPDLDWATLDVTAGEQVMILAQPLEDSSAWPAVTLLAADGVTELVSRTAGGAGEPLYLFWTADRDGVVFVRVASADPAVFGSGAAYQLTIAPRRLVFLPLGWK